MNHHNFMHECTRVCEFASFLIFFFLDIGMSDSENKENSTSEASPEHEESSTAGKYELADLFKPLNNVTKRGRKRKLLKTDDDSFYGSLNTDTDDRDDGSKRARCSSNGRRERLKLGTEIRQTLNNFENYMKNSKNILNLHCDFLRNEINVQTEDLCKRVEQFHGNMLKQLKNYERNCSKNIAKKDELCKYGDLIAEVKSKLVQFYTNTDDDDDENTAEQLNQLNARVLEAKNEYKNFIFGHKIVKFEKNLSKEFNLIGCLKERCMYKNAGLNIKRLIECIQDIDDNNNEVFENESDDKTLKWMKIIEAIKFKTYKQIKKSAEGTTEQDDHEKFISKIDYDKAILCKKTRSNFNCEFKVLDLHTQQAKGTIAGDYQIQKFNLKEIATSNQFVFLLGQNHKLPKPECFVLEKYDQYFNLYTRLTFQNDKKPIAVACNQSLVVVLVESVGNTTEKYSIEAYSCDDLKPLLKSNFVLDYSADEDVLFDAVMSLNNDNHLRIVINRSFIHDFDVLIEWNYDDVSPGTSDLVSNDLQYESIQQIEIKQTAKNTVKAESLDNFYIDSLQNLLSIDCKKELNFNYYSNNQPTVDSFKLDAFEDGEKFIVTNDGFFVLFKNNFNVEIY